MRNRRSTPIIEAAIARGDRLYFTGEPCIREHIDNRYVAGGSCVKCLSESRERRAQKAPEDRSERFLSERQLRVGKIVNDARSRGDKHYFTGDPCKKGHIDKRLVSTGNCVSCAPIRDKQFRTNRPDYFQRDNVKARIAKSKRGRYGKNPEKFRRESREWSQSNPEKAAARALAGHLANPGRRNAYAAARKVARIRASPKWADKKSIAAIYRRAAQKTKIEGFEYHVDHIVPLRSKFVCGLHCEANLQVITGPENLSKHNSWWPDMWSKN